MNPFGIDLEKDRYSSYSLEDLHNKEKRLVETLREKQTLEPSLKRKQKTDYDTWVRSIANMVDELQRVRDEIFGRLDVGEENGNH